MRDTLDLVSVLRENKEDTVGLGRDGISEIRHFLAVDHCFST